MNSSLTSLTDPPQHAALVAIQREAVRLFPWQHFIFKILIVLYCWREINKCRCLTQRERSLFHFEQGYDKLVFYFFIMRFTDP